MVRLVKDRLKRSGSIRRKSNKYQKGFSLLELVVGMAIIGILASVAVPALFRQVPQFKRDEFLTNLNTIVREASIRSLETGNPHKVGFNLSEGTIKMEEQTSKVDGSGDYIFKPAQVRFAKIGDVIPDAYDIKQFFVQGVDEIGTHSGSDTIEDIWFFVIPEGLAQEVVLNILDTSDVDMDTGGVQMSLVLNPFTVQFRIYNEFQQPSSS
jgi:prepilin-type N-terminal cleavage/methylation domain-containing protein